MLVELDSRYMIFYFGFKLILTRCLTPFLCKPQASLQNPNDPDFDLSSSLSVKCNFAVDFHLMSNSKHKSISHSLAVICTWKSLIIWPQFQTANAKSNHFFQGQREGQTK